MECEGGCIQSNEMARRVDVTTYVSSTFGFCQFCCPIHLGKLECNCSSFLVNM